MKERVGDEKLIIISVAVWCINDHIRFYSQRLCTAAINTSNTTRTQTGDTCWTVAATGSGISSPLTTPAVSFLQNRSRGRHLTPAERNEEIKMLLLTSSDLNDEWLCPWTPLGDQPPYPRYRCHLCESECTKTDLRPLVNSIIFPGDRRDYRITPAKIDTPRPPLKS